MRVMKFFVFFLLAFPALDGARNEEMAEIARKSLTIMTVMVITWFVAFGFVVLLFMCLQSRLVGEIRVHGCSHLWTIVKRLWTRARGCPVVYTNRLNIDGIESARILIEDESVADSP
ncbi:hypothetical protein B9Z55_024077 [Caenorhabditis nigoni]|uniref:Uncharacterized protein n=2 Tax=Caenorhabditis nigoni TaxID=1611254 RepID=A0A2G5SSZ7_9PELO|nr:hypothetical protein B9Z55_024077 [Caenorhabditis nigoni]